MTNASGGLLHLYKERNVYLTRHATNLSRVSFSSQYDWTLLQYSWFIYFVNMTDHRFVAVKVSHVSYWNLPLYIFFICLVSAAKKPSVRSSCGDYRDLLVYWFIQCCCIQYIVLHLIFNTFIKIKINWMWTYLLLLCRLLILIGYWSISLRCIHETLISVWARQRV